MKILANIFFIGAGFLFTHCGNSSVQELNSIVEYDSAREIYQLKTYHYKSTTQERTIDDYLETTYLPALKRQEINTIGVFKPRSNSEDSIKKTLVLIPFSSIDQFLTIESKLSADSEYQESNSNYVNASHTDPPYERINSVLMEAFVDMPQLAASPLTVSRSDRVYELRSYESATENYYHKKVDMFNAGGEIKLFDRLNFNAVFYAEVISGNKMPNLMYMTTFPNMEIRDSLWKEFFDSPEWTTLKAMDKYRNTVSHADIDFLFPTEYSDY